MPDTKQTRFRVRKTDADGRPVGELSYPTDPDVDAKLRDAGAIGGDVARKARQEAEAAGKIKRVSPGDWCDDVPEKSRPWLLAQRLIETVEVTRSLQDPGKET